MEILPHKILGDKGRQSPQSLIISSDVILTEALELCSSILFDRQGECWTPKIKAWGEKFSIIYCQCSLKDMESSKAAMLI